MLFSKSKNGNNLNYFVCGKVRRASNKLRDLLQSPLIPKSEHLVLKGEPFSSQGMTLIALSFSLHHLSNMDEVESDMAYRCGMPCGLQG